MLRALFRSTSANRGPGSVRTMLFAFVLLAQSLGTLACGFNELRSWACGDDVSFECAEAAQDSAGSQDLCDSCGPSCPCGCCPSGAALLASFPATVTSEAYAPPAGFAAQTSVQSFPANVFRPPIAA